MAVKKDPRLSEPLQGDGPGAYLRKAREEAETSVDKVATALLLNASTVEALEADAYERLPAPTFVRGYLRGYARVLGIPSRPVLEMYDRQGFEPPPLSTDVTEPTQAHTSDAVVRIVTYAVAVVLVVLVALWWHSQEDGGFGIAADLFDRSADTGEDPSPRAAREPGTVPADGDADADGASVATVSGPADEPPLDEAFSVPPPAEDTGFADLSSGDPPPDGAELEGTGTDGESGAETVRQPGDETPAEDTAVTDAVEEVTPGEIVELGPSPAHPEAQSESTAAAPLQPGISTGDGAPVATTPDGEAASEDTVAVESAPPVTPVPEAGANPEASAAREPQSGTVAGVDGTAADAPGLATSPNGGEDAAGESASAPLPARPAPETAEATTGIGAAPSGLVLEFVHESWVEVYDRERTRLFFGLVQPGRMLSFDGLQPFDVLLGYGKDVRVAIDGQAFDHTPFLKHGVARFSIGAGPDDGTDVADTAETAPPDAAETPAGDNLPPVRDG